MSGRGDNNKQGSAGRGINNQSNQAFVADNKSEPKSDHNKNVAGAKTLSLLVDEVPYEVRVEPFTFNDERRFYVSVNGGTSHVFTWDSEIKTLRAIDDDAVDLPDALEQAISQKLQSQQI
jgi:hypothetical protein